jgi:hypothetical protein
MCSEFSQSSWPASAQSGGRLLFHLISRPYEQSSVIVTTNLAFAAGTRCFAGVITFGCRGRRWGRVALE